MPVAGDKLVCLRNNRKKGLFNGGLWSVKERGAARRGIMTMRLLPDDETATRGVKVSVRPECFVGGIEEIDWQQPQALRRVRLRLCADRAQVAGLAMGRRRAVRRELRVFREPRALALYRHHPRGEAADDRGVRAAALTRR